MYLDDVFCIYIEVIKIQNNFPTLFAIILHLLICTFRKHLEVLVIVHLLII